MQQRYFLIEPKYSELDTFCNFIVGSDRTRASIQIYADIWMLEQVAALLTSKSLSKESPHVTDVQECDEYFGFYMTVLPHEGEDKHLRFRIFQDGLDDGAPFRSEIRFKLTQNEATELADMLRHWCKTPVYSLVFLTD